MTRTWDGLDDCAPAGQDSSNAGLVLSRAALRLSADRPARRDRVGRALNTGSQFRRPLHDPLRRCGRWDGRRSSSGVTTSFASNRSLAELASTRLERARQRAPRGPRAGQRGDADPRRRRPVATPRPSRNTGAGPDPDPNGRHLADGMVVMTYVDGGSPRPKPTGVASPTHSASCIGSRTAGRTPGLAIVDRPSARRDRTINLGAMRLRVSFDADGVGRDSPVARRRRPRQPQPGQHPHDRGSRRDDRLDEAHVNVPDLDLALPRNAAGLDDDAYESPRKRRPHGEPPSAGTPPGPTSSQSSGSPKFERSEQQRIDRGQRSEVQASQATS